MIKIKTMATLLGANLDEILNKTDISTDVLEKTPQKVSTLNNLMQLLGLVLLLAFIFVAAYFTSKFLAGIRADQMKNSNFKIIDSYPIGQGKILQIVKIGTRYIVIAIDKNSINFLMELNEDDFIIEKNKEDIKLDFKKILDKFQSK